MVELIKKGIVDLRTEKVSQDKLAAAPTGIYLFDFKHY